MAEPAGQAWDLAKEAASLIAGLPAACTVLDSAGRLVYYNPYAASLLDRRPAYLGRDVRAFHQPGSQDKISFILDCYRRGDFREFAWRGSRNGVEMAVHVTPWRAEGGWRGVLHVVSVVPAADAAALISD
ncbi:MAG: PAS domain-containing protein [Deltaproteobacteria bacterium]|nr:PAS domain-containing protein [Deltaproteobacteria bacterium]